MLRAMEAARDDHDDLKPMRTFEQDICKMWQICWLVATLYSLEDRHPFGNLKVSDGERLAVVSKNNIYKEREEYG